MEITWEKNPSTQLHNLIPGDTFVTGDAYYIVTNNGLFPAPLPDDIVCVNLDTGGIRMFRSTDIVFITKLIAIVKK